MRTEPDKVGKQQESIFDQAREVLERTFTIKASLESITLTVGGDLPPDNEPKEAQNIQELLEYSSKRLIDIQCQVNRLEQLLGQRPLSPLKKSPNKLGRDGLAYER